MHPSRFKALEWDLSAQQELVRGRFLTLRRHLARNIYEQGEPSAWYEVESAWPPFLDAVVLLLYHLPPDDGEPSVALRRSVRPVPALRRHSHELNGLDKAPWSGAFWELPAGGVEAEDLAPGGGGPASRASIEAWEEAGLVIDAESFEALGEAPFSAPALSPERLHYLAARVADPAQAAPPPGDGHPMEDGAEVRFIPLGEALRWCAEGRIADLKSEVGLRRLHDRLLLYK